MKTRKFSCSLILVLVLSLIWPSGVLAAMPTNDNFDNATVINQLPFSDAIGTTEATVSADDPNCAGQGATVWYRYTPAVNSNITANTFGSSYDTTLSVYTGVSGSLLLITCNDDYSGLQSFVQFSAQAGETYYIMAGSYGGGPGGSLVLSVNQLIPPANDDVDNAVSIDSLPFTDSRDTAAATTASDDPYCAYNGHSVWYAFTPDANGKVEVNTTTSNYYASIAIWTGPRGAWGYVACAYSQQLRFDAVAGQTYYIMIGSPGNSGSLTLSVNLLPPPANDDVDNAIVIGSLPLHDTRDASGATTASDDPFCGSRESSVWYSFTPTADTRIELDTTASNYYATISVWTGPRGSWGYVNCNNAQRVRVDAIAGQTYYIMISTYGTGGNLALSVTLAPPPLAIQLNLDPTGSVRPTSGTATVQGTVTCNQSAYINGWGYVQQKIGQGLVQGYIYIGGSCDPSTPMAWTSTLYSQPVQEVGGGRAATLFTGGRATATMYVSGWSPYFYEYAWDDAATTITLRGR